MIEQRFTRTDIVFDLSKKHHAKERLHFAAKVEKVVQFKYGIYEEKQQNAEEQLTTSWRDFFWPKEADAIFECMVLG